MRKFLLLPSLMFLVLLGLSGCGEQTPTNTPPAGPAAAGEKPADPPGKVCSEAAKVCPGGAVPTVDAATCAQTCPGE